MSGLCHYLRHAWLAIAIESPQISAMSNVAQQEAHAYGDAHHASLQPYLL